MDILCDSGFLIALFAKDDIHHKSARTKLEEFDGAALHTVWEVMAEAGHMIGYNGRAALLEWVAEGRLTIHPSEQADVRVMLDLLKRYKNRRPDYADISLILLADRLNTNKIFTVDRNDFDTYRTLKGKPFDRLWVQP